MKFLLDTHALLWFIERDAQISEKARQILEDTGNEILASVVGLFEISIKLKIGKMTLLKHFSRFVQDVETAFITVIPITTEHLTEYQNLREIVDHRDPFDRLILATGESEKAVIISVDPKINQYKHEVEVIW
ncbi:type II toxin-antitoxin system VapC family toxin [Dyadobacter sp. MSC1_007]|jgi:PIN domain nuclease of toxin-antitoxin system|uniref:type II toxin-antitoxin system VapC family toxin n=1 Tax=Dyadobacter sp. MSC1_007 TaxID=2909264 RepID=UPI00202E107A|nr:type II toxin-antitoxin system VapC family toxin [Dyadobacter sp. MSC1_007]